MDGSQPIYIRLGRAQDAYDLMKSYATTGQDSSYDWGNIDMPFLDPIARQPPGILLHTSLYLRHAVALVLIKVRILLDLQAIQNSAVTLSGPILPGDC